MSTLNELCSHLSFDFKKSLLPSHAAQEFADARIAFHQFTESTRNQSIFTLTVLNLLLAELRPDRPRPYIAILLPDILPETSEMSCFILLDALIRVHNLIDISNVTIISRRGAKLLDKLPRAFNTIKIYWDWESPKVLASFDLVFVMCSAMHFHLIHELTANQEMYSKTLFVVSSAGIPIHRAKKMLRTNNIVMPNIKSMANLACHELDQMIDNGSVTIGPTLWVPDLDILKQFLETIYLEAGIHPDIYNDAISKIIVMALTRGSECFGSCKADLHDFPLLGSLV
ncbi:hypothetical protein BASA81_011465 [Batrachochytrium salamandrivorans]|nr:hypothetical protein BASA81_011465 [Batrachochytrium salamandrivorans]